MNIVQSVMPARSIQNPARPKPREATHATPNSPACGGSPLLIPPHAGESEGDCHAERSEASEIPPNQNTATPPNLLPHAALQSGARLDSSLPLRMTRVRQGAGAPAALQSGAQGRFANRLCCAAAAWQLMHSMLANPPSTYG